MELLHSPGNMRLDSLAVLLGAVCSINLSRWAVYSFPSFSSPHANVARDGSRLQVVALYPFHAPSMPEAEAGSKILAKYNTSNTHGSAEEKYVCVLRGFLFHVPGKQYLFLEKIQNFSEGLQSILSQTHEPFQCSL